MTELTDYNSSSSFVFALETTPDHALQIYSLVAKLMPSTSLRASPNDKWLYKDKFGFEYDELDCNEPVRAALKNMSDARRARIASLTQNTNANLFVEYPNVVFIALGAIGAGFAGEIGKDLWTSVKIVLKRLWNWLRQDKEHAAELVRLIADLEILHRNETALDLVILLQMSQARLTFIIDPWLPEKAIKQAERLILRPKRNYLESTPSVAPQSEQMASGHERDPHRRSVA